MFSLRNFFLCLGAYLLLGTSLTLAQTQTPSIELKDLVPQLENLAQFLNQIEVKLVDSEDIKKLNEQVKDMAEVVANSSQTARRIDVMNYDELTQIEQPFLNQLAELTRWTQRLSSQIAELTTSKDTLAAKHQLWFNTLQNIAQDGSVVLIKGQIREALAHLDSTDKAVQGRLDRLLFIQSQVSGLAGEVHKNLDLVASARQKFRTELWMQDSPAFYTQMFVTQVIEQCRFTTLATLTAQQNALNEYLHVNYKKLIKHALLFLLIAWLTFRFRRLTVEIESLKPIFGQPITFILTSWLLLSFLIYEKAPTALYDMVGVALIIPVAFFLRGLLGEKYLGLIFGSAGLFLFDSIRNLSQSFSGISQLVFFCELSLAGYLSVKLVRISNEQRATNSSLGEQRLLRFIGFLGGIFKTIFAVGAILVALGYYRLALFIGETLLSLIYSALILFVSSSLILALLFALLETPISRGLNSIQNHKLLIQTRFRQLVIFALTLTWLGLAVKALVIDEKVLLLFNQALASGLEFKNLSISLHGVLVFGFSIWLTFKASRIANAILQEDIYPRRSWDPGVRHALSVGLHYLIIITGLFFALSLVGIDLQNVAIIAGALSVGIGFGLQTVVNNFISGLILLIERPIKLGDFISFSGTFGYVTKIGIRASTIRTLDDAEIIVPNGTLISDSLTNWTLSSARARVSVKLGVEYGTNVEYCISILKESALKVEGILGFPEPSVLFKAFGESSLDFELRAWIANAADRDPVSSALLISAEQSLAKAGIKIPFPRRDIRIIDDSPIVPSHRKRMIGSAIILLCYMLGSSVAMVQAQEDNSAISDSQADTPALPDPTLGQPSGIVLNADNIQAYKKLVIPELYPLIKSGTLNIPASKTLKYAWNIFDDQQENITTTLEYGSYFDKAGSLLTSFKLQAGLPFKNLSLEDEKGHKILARKVLLNSIANWWSLKILDLDFDLISFDEEKPIRGISGNLRRIYPTTLNPADKTVQLFRERIEFLSPSFLKNYVWLTFRFRGDEEDGLWANSPLISKSRQLTGSNRSDALVKSATSSDDFLVWSSKIELLEPELVTKIVALSPFASLETANVIADGDNCFKIVDSNGTSLQKTHWNFDSKSFANAAPWTPTSGVYVPRDLYRIEVSSKDPYSNEGRKIIYVEARSFFPVVKIIYDRTGQRWKTIFAQLGLAHNANNSQKFPYMASQVVIDHINKTTNIIDFSSIRYCSNFPANILLENFDPRHLVSMPVAQSNASPSPIPSSSPAIIAESLEDIDD